MVKILYDGPLPHSRSYRAAIGDIAIQFAMLESLVDRGICFLLGVEERNGRVFTTRMGFNQRLEMLKDYAKQALSKTDFKQFASWASKVSDLQTRRNTIIHGVWAKDAGDNMFLLSFRGAKRQEGEAIPYSLDDLIQLNQEIAEQGYLLQVHLQKWGVLESLPDKPQTKP